MKQPMNHIRLIRYHNIPANFNMVTHPCSLEHSPYFSIKIIPSKRNNRVTYKCHIDVYVDVDIIIENLLTFEIWYWVYCRRLETGNLCSTRYLIELLLYTFEWYKRNMGAAPDHCFLQNHKCVFLFSDVLCWLSNICRFQPCFLLLC